MRRWLSLFFFMLLICNISTPVQAQRAGVTGVFMGTVTTPSGAPVSHAQILVLDAERSLVGGRKKHRHRTDQDGTFRLRLPVGQYWVQVVAVGFVPHWFEDATERHEATLVVIDEPGAEVVWPVVITPLASVFGNVTDESSGLAIDGGVVLIEGDGNRLRKHIDIENGYFLAEGLVPGNYRMQVLVAGYVAAQSMLTVRAGDEIGPVQVVLSKGLSVTGQVVGQNGEPLEGARVMARSVLGRDRVQGALSLADGAYHISGLVPGDYVIEVHKAGFATQFYNGQTQMEKASRLRVDGSRGLTGIDFVLGQVGAIVGHIKNAQNEPVAGARVVAEPVGEGKRQQTRSDKDGHYVLPHVAKGAYLVRVFADGYMPFYYNGVQTNGEATSVDVTDDAHTDAVNFVLLPGGKIQGHVRDGASNQHVGNALVSARWVGHQGLWQTQTDATGRFELADLPSGKFVLQVRARRYVSTFYGQVSDAEQAVPISVEAGSEVTDIAFDLTRRQPGDFDGSGHIDFQDLMQLVRHVMNKTAFDDQLDLNGDGEIGLADFLAFLDLRAGKVASAQSTLRWQQVENDGQTLVAQLDIDHMPPAKGYVLQVNYDDVAGELLGAEKVESGAFGGRPLMVQRYSGTVLIALDGDDVTFAEKQGALVQLRFRLKGDVTAVPLEIGAAWLFGKDGQLVPMNIPATFSLELPPQTFRLMQNVPNPFNPATTIAFELPEAADVDVAVYNLVGQRLRTLVREHKAPGRYQVVWDGQDDLGRDVSSGLYFYRYRAGDFWATRRMLLVR